MVYFQKGKEICQSGSLAGVAFFQKVTKKNKCYFYVMNGLYTVKTKKIYWLHKHIDKYAKDESLF